MIAFEEAARLVRLQERIKSATLHELKKDGHHKSSEAAMSISFSLPAMFADDQRPYWAVEAYSYILCPQGRSDTWIGRSASEAISKAEDAVSQWCMSSEMEQFGELFGMGDDGQSDEADVPS